MVNKNQSEKTKDIAPRGKSKLLTTLGLAAIATLSTGCRSTSFNKDFLRESRATYHHHGVDYNMGLSNSGAFEADYLPSTRGRAYTTIRLGPLFKSDK